MTSTGGSQGPGRETNATLRQLVIGIYLLRHEAALFVILLLLMLGGGAFLGTVPAILTVVVLIAGVLALPKARTATARLLYAASIRRQWHRAVEAARLADRPPLHSRAPNPLVWYRATKVRASPLGDRLTVRLGPGQSAENLEAKTDLLAPRIRGVLPNGVRIERTGTARHVNVVLQRRDPFRHADPIPSPLLHMTDTSVWDPLPCGVTEEGAPVHLSTMGEGHLLVAGATRSGKSVFLNQVVAQAALDPQAQLVLLDYGQVEFTPWQTCALEFVGPDVKRATEALDRLRQIMRHRNQELVARGARKISAGEKTYTVFIDELSRYLLDENTKEAKAFYLALLDLLQQGAKAGIRVAVAMQRPSATILNTNLRDQLTYRVCFRVLTPETTMMALGSRDHAAHLIPPGPSHQGVGYIGTDYAPPFRFRSYWLTDENVRETARKATTSTLDDELAALTAPVPKPPTLTRAQRDEQKLREVLPTQGEGVARPELERLISAPWAQIKRPLDVLLANGYAERTGDGKPGRPYRYRKCAGTARDRAQPSPGQEPAA